MCRPYLDSISNRLFFKLWHNWANLIADWLYLILRKILGDILVLLDIFKESLSFKDTSQLFRIEMIYSSWDLLQHYPVGRLGGGCT